MKLQDTLLHYDIALKFKFTLPDISKISRAARNIDKFMGGGVSNDLIAPRKLLDEGLKAILSGNLSNLSAKTLRIFCTAGLSELDKLTDPFNAFQMLLKEVSKRARSSLVKALFLGYLLSADLESSWVNALRIYLLERQECLSPRWKERIRQYGLLDKDPGEYFGNLFFKFDNSFSEGLLSAGITGILLTSGIGKRVFKAVSQKLGHSGWTQRDDALDIFNRFKRYIFQEDKLIFAASINQRELCFALLEPCINGDPNDAVLREIRNLLIIQYSDPRVNSGRWSNVDQRHVQVLRRWLTKQSMGLLIEVLNRTADDNHWDVRNDFWKFYLDNDYVSEAWVVFGSDAFQHAKDLVKKNPEFTASNFGRFQIGGRSVQSNHSVLLMRIGDVIVAEWTHDGRVRLWDSSSSRRPKFYQITYLPEALRGASPKYTSDDEYSHDRPGNWMRKVDKFVRARTGIKHPLNVKSGTERDASITRIRKLTAHFGRDVPLISERNDAAFRFDVDSAISDVVNKPTKLHRCARCGVEKSADQFFESKKRPGELTVHCISCLKNP
jgi:hypothetical protein